MKFSLEPWNRGITDAQLLDDLRRVATELGRATVSYNEYRELGRCSAKTFEKRFGSWNKGLAAAGLQVGVRHDVSELELFENLEAAWVGLGRQPRREELRKPLSKYSGGIYERRFGGWRKTLEAFVVWVDSQDKATGSQPREPKAGPRFPDLRLRFRVMSRDSFRCQSCGRSPATEAGVELHVDHVTAWSKGGATEESNLKTLCSKCNLGKGDA